MDPRHVLTALAVLIAVGCASSEEAESPSSTASVVAPSSTVVSETSQPSPSDVESSEGDANSPGTTTMKPDPGASSESPVTTTSLLQEIETGQSSESSVEQSESDASDSESAAVQIAAGIDSAVAVLQSRLEALTVQPERRSGYDRDLFDHWVDADGDGCDARREVLIAEADVIPSVGASCALVGGEWVSVYDGITETGTGSGFDVDHLVPLAEAWDSGAYAWDSDTRRGYANDLEYEHSLVAVSSSSNRQKGAADPAEWLPPEVSVRCWYAEAWITVKTRWELSVDTGELQALRALVSQCDDWQLGSAPILASPISAPATTVPIQTAASTSVEAANDDLCHPSYIPCLPNLPGDAVNCGDLSGSQKPVEVRTIGVDPYRLDRDRDGQACES